MQSRPNMFRFFLVVATLVFATSAISAQQSDTQTLTGVVSDAVCGPNHFIKT